MSIEYDWPEGRQLQPEIKVTAYLPSKSDEKLIRTLWDKLLMRGPSMIYFRGWLETDDSKGFLNAGDVIFVGETPQDPNGVTLYIKKLTSHNDSTRTYEICSTTPTIKGRPIKTRRIFKLYSTIAL